jgi:hypothetical protein
MRSETHRPARRRLLAAAPLALALLLGACGDDDNDSPIVTTPSPSPSPSSSPSPGPVVAARNVTRCLNQVIPGTNGATPASLVIPDTLKLDFSRPPGFPNGRLLSDPVIDVTLAVLLLDLTKHSPATFASLPLNPPRNEVPFLNAFPFLAPPNGVTPTVGTGTTFNFRTDPVSSYVRVDRMGQPAVATALIGSSRKNAYNDADPDEDVTQAFVPDIVAQLTGLHNALADDLQALNLTPCSTPG